MIDIKFIRENPEIVKNDLKKRGLHQKIEWIDDLIEKEKRYRQILQECEKLRHDRNILTEEINQLKKQGRDINEKIQSARELPQKISNLENEITKIKDKINYYLMNIPNILHQSVPVGKDDSENVIVRSYGKIPKKKFELKAHGELLEELGLADFSSAGNVSGNGFYYLLGDIALLELALINYAINNLTKKGYVLVTPPFMLRRKPYEGVTSLDDFQNMMYKIDGEDLYLIATSEHSIASMHIDKIFNTAELPLKYVGISPCFRKEIGSHGIDTKGLFRVHQFYKVEQFIFSLPKDSWGFHEELIKNAEELFKGLKLPYRIVNICTGDIGMIASKKYDLEVYMPREGKYREVVSCSNCTSYQAVRLNMKYKDGEQKDYVHTLNSTAIATTRVIRAIVENYQQEDGTISVPTVLRRYMQGKKIIGTIKN